MEPGLEYLSDPESSCGEPHIIGLDYKGIYADKEEEK